MPNNDLSDPAPPAPRLLLVILQVPEIKTLKTCLERVGGRDSMEMSYRGAQQFLSCADPEYRNAWLGALSRGIVRGSAAQIDWDV